MIRMRGYILFMLVVLGYQSNFSFRVSRICNCKMWGSLKLADKGYTRNCNCKVWGSSKFADKSYIDDRLIKEWALAC